MYIKVSYTDKDKRIVSGSIKRRDLLRALEEQGLPYYTITAYSGHSLVTIMGQESDIVLTLIPQGEIA